jgi:serine/threonine protein kinase/HAMP domain-containing protein
MSPPGARPPADDPDATRVLGGAPAHDPDQTVVRPDPEQTIVRPTRPVPSAPPLAPAPAQAAAPARPIQPKSGTALALPPGFRLHEYRIDRVLGQGGFGITYLATDVNLNTRVAIKEYLPEEIAFRKSGQTVSAHSSRYRDRYKSGLDSFLVEGRTLATFRHPNIVRVARFFEAHQTAYMVLEYERGSPLKAWWPQHATLGERELVRLLDPLLDGLAVVHQAGFLHRDIKPDNIQVRRGNGSLVLLDFGSARQAVGTQRDADVAVTPGFAPIEQYEDGEQGAWTDIYAFGATLYWLVSGHKPPEATERQMAVARGEPDPLRPAAEVAAGRQSPPYSAPFYAAIDWALKLDPRERPQDVAAWRQALFAAHTSSLGLKEALQASEGAERVHASRWARFKARARLVLRDFFEPTSWPLAVKMTLAMVLTALLPMLITSYYNLRVNLQTVSQAELGNMEQLAQSTAGRVAQLISDSQHLARMVGTDADFVQFLARPDAAELPAMQAKVDTLLRANPDIDLMMVMDRAGTALVASDAKVSGRNFAFRDYFKRAMQGQPNVTGIIVGTITGAAGMFYAHPVFEATPAGGQPAVIGAVVLRIRGAAFDAILDDVRHEARLTPFMVDGDGILIYHSNRSVLYSSLGPLPPAKLAEIRADQRFKRNDIVNLGMPDLARAVVRAPAPGHISYHSTVMNAEQVAGFAPVRGHDWVVGVSESRASFEAPLNNLFVHMLWSVALVGLLFMGLALRFARSIVEPIRGLIRAVHALKRGDFDHANVEPRSRDEIGRLGRAFNVMIDVLRQRERERDQPPRGGA